MENLFRHIFNTAKIPSFSTYEERLHPYVAAVFSTLSNVEEIEVKGKNMIYRIGNNKTRPPIALSAHLDKINHYGKEHPVHLPVKETEYYLEGAMDDCAGVGVLLALAEMWNEESWPDLFFFFSEMEESKGLKEHPDLLRNNGKGYHHGMGAKRIAKRCLKLNNFPAEIITIDTTPLFNGDSGVALYANHWELNDLQKPSPELRKATHQTVNHLLTINNSLILDNNTNDYLHYGEVFNKNANKAVVSIALEPAIYPYHQKGERVFKKDMQVLMKTLHEYLSDKYR